MADYHAPEKRPNELTRETDAMTHQSQPVTNLEEAEKASNTAWHQSHQAVTLDPNGHLHEPANRTIGDKAKEAMEATGQEAREKGHEASRAISRAADETGQWLEEKGQDTKEAFVKAKTAAGHQMDKVKDEFEKQSSKLKEWTAEKAEKVKQWAEKDKNKDHLG
ncbi:hypothetical protein C4J81_04805 [Deltaproteobacteria bacterium Smac51]|nr:hypothetical protein C4J81_04805 [Deltaproteobacteria bacterium Smac51]